ncbi:MAG: hypothetical protein ACM3O4_04430 [Ignavibacteriales bacterium]
MKDYHKYQYQETNKSYLLTITFSLDKINVGNQDNIFNEVITHIIKLETLITLSNDDIININKFIRLARHSRQLDIRKFLK